MKNFCSIVKPISLSHRKKVFEKLKLIFQKFGTKRSKGHAAIWTGQTFEFRQPVGEKFGLVYDDISEKNIGHILKSSPCNTQACSDLVGQIASFIRIFEFYRI